MKPAYDSLTSTLPKTASAKSRKRSDDFDDVGHIVGFNIQRTAKHVDLSRVETIALPLPTTS